MCSIENAVLLRSIAKIVGEVHAITKSEAFSEWWLCNLVD